MTTCEKGDKLVKKGHIVVKKIKKYWKYMSH